MKFTYKKIYYLLLEQNYQEHGVGYVFIIGTLFVMNLWGSSEALNGTWVNVIIGIAH